MADDKDQWVNLRTGERGDVVTTPGQPTAYSTDPEVEAALRDFRRDIDTAFVREWILGLPPRSRSRHSRNGS